MSNQGNIPATEKSFKIKYGTNKNFEKNSMNPEEGSLYFCFKDDPDDNSINNKSAEAFLYGVIGEKTYNIAPLYKEDVTMKKNLAVEENAVVYGNLTLDGSNGIEDAQIPFLKKVHLIIGNPLSKHLEIDDNEILAKNTQNIEGSSIPQQIASTLYLNQDTEIAKEGEETQIYPGGQVSIGSGGIGTKGTVLITKTTNSSLATTFEDDLPAFVIGNVKANRLEMDRNHISAKLYSETPDSNGFNFQGRVLYLNGDTEIGEGENKKIINGGLVYVGRGGLRVLGETKLGYDDKKVVIGIENVKDTERTAANPVPNLEIHNNTTIGKYTNSSNYEDRTLKIYGNTTIGHIDREKNLKVYGNVVVGDEVSLEATNKEKSITVYGTFTSTKNAYLANHGGNVTIGENIGTLDTNDSLTIYNNMILGTPTDQNRNFDMYGRFTLNGALDLNDNGNDNTTPHIFINSTEDIGIVSDNLGPFSIGSNEKSANKVILQIDANEILSKKYNATKGTYEGSALHLNPDETVGGETIQGGTVNIGSGGLKVTGNTSLSGTLTVTKATTLNNTLTVAGATRINNTLTIHRDVSSNDASAKIIFSVKRTNLTDFTSNTSYIAVYDDFDDSIDPNTGNIRQGENMVIRATTSLVLGSGESASAIYSDIIKNYENKNTEKTYLTSDESIEFYTDCQTGTGHTRRCASLDVDGQFILHGTARGVFLTDSAGHEYPGIFDNGANLWIGSKQTQSIHHHGKTYISAGFTRKDGATSDAGGQGNETIYVSVPNADNSNGANYKVFHDGMVSANRINYKNSDKSLASSLHYISNDKISINETSAKSYNLYVNGSACITNGSTTIGGKFIFQDTSGIWGTADPSTITSPSKGQVYFKIIPTS